MKKLCVIGYPVKHSLSPRLHGYWIKKYGVAATYDAVEVLPEMLDDFVRRAVRDGYGGFNVTVPHKRAMMDFCETLDDVAQKTGAVNLVRIDEKGALHGSNTDMFGFNANLESFGVPHPQDDRPALVLGAGGAARAVLCGLLAYGYRRIKIANRTFEKAQDIAALFDGVEAVTWDARDNAATDISLLVNTTSLGMAGQKPLLFDVLSLPDDAAVCDIVYQPLYTNLLQQSQARGLRIVTGIGMLLHQARPSFAEWFGIMPDIDDGLLAALEGGQ